MQKIFVIEDDENIRNLVKIAMEGYGYQVAAFETAEEALEELDKEKPDLAVFDLMLPGMDGLAAIRLIRERPDNLKNIPIIVLTAKDKEYDKVVGLDGGADDYMTKPFSIAVLKLRIAKLLERKERADGAGETQILRSGPISIHTGLIKVWEGEEELECSVTEYKLLKFFLDHPGQVLTRNQILDAVWDSRGKYVSENTLQVNIGRLRKKLDKENPDRFIKTIHGIGYLWEEEG